MTLRQRRSRGREGGAAVVDFVLVLVVLLPLFLGVVHLGLVLHVRNTLTAAASEGARYAATVDRAPDAGAQRTRDQIRGALAADFATQVSSKTVSLEGVPGVRVSVAADVPPLGLWGPRTHLEVTGHAVEEVTP